MRDFDPPIIVNCRDRVTPLRKLVDWLQRAGHEHIYLLDNASTYPELYDWLRYGGHGCGVLHLERNCGARALWTSQAAALRMWQGYNAGYGGPHDLRHEWFVYTDPDIVPIEACPFDAVDVLHDALTLYPQHTKAALGLYLDDLPEDFEHLEWETRLLHPRFGDSWTGHIGDINGARIYDSLADTTFALYRPGAQFGYHAIRTGYPYQARHLSPSWYGGEWTDEDRYYFEHANSGPLASSWKGIE